MQCGSEREEGRLTVVVENGKLFQLYLNKSLKRDSCIKYDSCIL